MKRKKALPPRTAYSIEEAKQELGCSIRALLDWANQGFIKICLEVKEETRLEMIPMHKYRYEDRGKEKAEAYVEAITLNREYLSEEFGKELFEDFGNKNIKKRYDSRPDISQYTASVEMNTTLNNWSHNRNGQAHISLHLDWQGAMHDKVFDNEQKQLDENKEISVVCPAIIQGFWELPAHIFREFDVSSDNQVEVVMRAYGGDAEAVTRISLCLDDLVLMSAELEKLRNYNPESNKRTDQQLSEDTNQNRPKKPNKGWKIAAEQEAIALGYPKKGKQETVANDIATRLQHRGITKTGGKPIDFATITRHVLTPMKQGKPVL